VKRGAVLLLGLSYCIQLGLWRASGWRVTKTRECCRKFGIQEVKVPGMVLHQVRVMPSATLPPPSPFSSPHADTPNIVVPPEVVAGKEVEVSCMVPDNCPELRPELSWLGHEELGEPTVLGRLREDEGTWVQVSLLHFVPTREANGHRLGCQAAFPNTTLQFEGYASLDVKCEPGCGPGRGRGGAWAWSGREAGPGWPGVGVAGAWQGRGRVCLTHPLHLTRPGVAGFRPPGDCGDELLRGGHRGLPRQPALRG
jgi:hypothetical protein